jgi:cold shock CspA family protein
MTDTRIVGRIIKVSKSGYGFISSKEIEFTKIFFHWTSLKQDTLPFLELKIGMMVEFTPLQIPDKGYRAIHVRVIPREKDDGDKMPTLQERQEGTDRTDS